ncbi:MAG TPA: LacI family transcriptional regulator [Firmicutes bacterium]|nr:LacI family transcriptional regulator [Bacillota bacterium]
MMITIKDIARICKVSTTTVSRVINNKTGNVSEETKERIIKVMEELNYQPNFLARSMVTRKTDTIAIIVPDICNPFFADLARGVEDTCIANGYHLFLCNTDMDSQKEEEYIRLLRERFVDGMVVSTQNDEEYNEIFTKMIKDQYPFVFVERYSDKLSEVPGVFANNVQGAYEITKYLITLGHKDIAFLSGPLVTSNARFRLEGYKKGMVESDLPINNALIRHGDYKTTSGYEQTKYLLEEGPRFSALFASNDLMAFGAYQAVKEFGLKIPQDVSIVGFDNINMPGVLEPKITSMEIPAYKMGVKAAQILLGLIKGKKPKKDKVFYSLKLIDKGSATLAN